MGEKFDQPEFQTAMLGEFLTVWEAQRCYEDVLEYALMNDHIKSEDEVVIVEPDANLKKVSGCGGCGGGKAKKPVAAPAG